MEFVVAKLSLKPGDVLLVGVPEVMRASEARDIQDMLGLILADYGIPNGVIVMPKEWDVSVVTPDG